MNLLYGFQKIRLKLELAYNVLLGILILLTLPFMLLSVFLIMIICELFILKVLKRLSKCKVGDTVLITTEDHGYMWKGRNSNRFKGFIIKVEYNDLHRHKNLFRYLIQEHDVKHTNEYTVWTDKIHPCKIILIEKTNKKISKLKTNGIEIQPTIFNWLNY